MKRVRRLRPVVFPMLLLALTACGGSSGGGMTSPYSDALFSGLYGMAEYSRSISNNENTSEFGSVTGDGMGMAVPTVGDNDGTTFNTPAVQSAVMYGVMADGTFTVPDETGRIAADGAAAISMKTTATESPNLRILLKLDGTYTLASLSGSYHGAIYLGAQCLWTTPGEGYYVADGAGTLTFPTNVAENLVGGHSLVNASGITTAYSITAQGLLTANLSGGDPALGGLTPDGAFAVLAGRSDSAGTVLMEVLLKVAVGASNATMSGSYMIVGLQSDPDNSNNFTSFLGTVTADGAGNLTVQPNTENEEGTITASTGNPATYSVAADGALSVDKFQGAISEDGRWGFLAGQADDSDAITTESPGLIILIRQ